MGQRVKCRRMRLETVEAKDIAFKSSSSGMAKEGQQGPRAGRTPTYSMHVANTCVSKTNFVAGEDKGKDSQGTRFSVLPGTGILHIECSTSHSIIFQDLE